MRRYTVISGHRKSGTGSVLTTRVPPWSRSSSGAVSGPASVGSLDQTAWARIAAATATHASHEASSPSGRSWSGIAFLLRVPIDAGSVGAAGTHSTRRTAATVLHLVVSAEYPTVGRHGA